MVSQNETGRERLGCSAPHRGGRRCWFTDRDSAGPSIDNERSSQSAVGRDDLLRRGTPCARRGTARPPARAPSASALANGERRGGWGAPPPEPPLGTVHNFACLASSTHRPQDFVSLRGSTQGGRV